MKAKILPSTSENIKIAAATLSRGEVVGMPTETVYGLAGAAFNEQALLKIFSTKERPIFDPLIVHVEKQNQTGPVLTYLEKLNLITLSPLSPPALQRAESLLQHFWPGPLTLVLPKNRSVPDLVTSGLQTVAIRMPRHPVAQALLKAVKTPLAAPSANRFGHISPTAAHHVFQELGERIEIILDGGECTIGLESTVVSVSPSGDLLLLRPGGIGRDAIEKVANTTLKIPDISQLNLPSPGMLERHYSPRKRLFLLSSPISTLTELQIKKIFSEQRLSKCFGILFFSDVPKTMLEFINKTTDRKVISEILSPTGDLQEAACRLFSLLRKLDNSEAEILFAEPCPTHEGLGYAIQDRLQRASATQM